MSNMKGTLEALDPAVLKHAYPSRRLIMQANTFFLI